MGRKGDKKTGGRRKGIPNKVTQTLIEKAEELGCNPFEVLIRFANGDWKGLGYDNEVYFKENAQGETKMGYTISPDLRAKCAIEAAKYLYPTRKAVEITGEVNHQLVERIKELETLPDVELQKIASGKWTKG